MTIYRTHVNAPDDQLVIGKSVVDPATGGWVLQLSRRIENDDRSFNGVIVATLDPAYLMRIYNSVNIGEHGYIRVIGLDGSVRATSGRVTSVLGQDFSNAGLFKRVSEAPNGWFYTGSFVSDNIPRLIAYRSVKDYPLIISVGFASHEIFSRLEALKQSGYLVAAILSLLILIVTGFSVRGQWLRERANKHMERANMLLNAALANMPHGICMFGADKKLVLANDLYSTMYGLDPKKTEAGMTLPEILQARVAAGCCPKNAQKYVADRMDEAFRPDPGYMVNELAGWPDPGGQPPTNAGWRVGCRSPGHHRAIACRTAIGRRQAVPAFDYREYSDCRRREGCDHDESLCSSIVHMKSCARCRGLEVLGKSVFEIYRTKDAERIDACD